MVENPYTQQRLERLAYRFPDGLTWHENWQRLALMGFRGAIVGTRGSGKSTLLREIHRRCRKQALDSTLIGPLDTLSDDPISEPAHCLAKDESTGLRTLLLNVPRPCRRGQRAGFDRRHQRRSIRQQLEMLDRHTILLIDGLERLSWLEQQWLVRRTASPTRCAGTVVTVHRFAMRFGISVWIKTTPTRALLDELLSDLGRSADRSLAKQRWQETPMNIRDVFRKLHDDWFNISHQRSIQS